MINKYYFGNEDKDLQDFYQYLLEGNIKLTREDNIFLKECVSYLRDEYNYSFPQLIKQVDLDFDSIRKFMENNEYESTLYKTFIDLVMDDVISRKKVFNTIISAINIDEP